MLLNLADLSEHEKSYADRKINKARQLEGLEWNVGSSVNNAQTVLLQL